MKTCAKCGDTKPTTEFSKHAGGKDGLRSCCKDCANAADAKYRAANPEKVKARKAAYRAANPEKVSAAAAAAYRAANPEKVKAAVAKYRASNPERVKENNAAWRASNPEKVKACAAAYRAANTEALRIYSHNRRARKRSNGGKLSTGLAGRLYKLQRGKCACCGKGLGSGFHRDHIMPLALGGTNTDDNMQLLCAPCNLQKHTKHPVDFMQSRGFLL